jgi:uncharacterized membrane protein YhaH (DUF805 family)
MRRRWWLALVFVGVLLALVGLTVLSGMSQFLVLCVGVLFVVVALYRRAGGTDYGREPPVPPGAPGP